MDRKLVEVPATALSTGRDPALHKILNEPARNSVGKSYDDPWLHSGGIWPQNGLIDADSYLHYDSAELYLQGPLATSPQGFSADNSVSRRNSSISSPQGSVSSDLSSISYPLALIQCPHDNCGCTRTFRRKSDLQRHLTKVAKPYDCRDCHRSFGSSADLRRHCREVHLEREDLAFKNRCPVPSCERHQRGFPRHWNLQDHYRRRHGGELPNNNSDEPEPMTIDSGDSSDSTASPPTSPSESSEISPPSAPIPIERDRSTDRARDSITSALENLRAERKDLDSRRDNLNRQIKALETVISEMDRRG